MYTYTCMKRITLYHQAIPQVYKRILMNVGCMVLTGHHLNQTSYMHWKSTQHEVFGIHPFGQVSTTSNCCFTNDCFLWNCFLMTTSILVLIPCFTLFRINYFLSHINLGECTLKGNLEAYSCEYRIYCLMLLSLCCWIWKIKYEFRLSL